jgi:hypothetical protein
MVGSNRRVAQTQREFLDVVVYITVFGQERDHNEMDFSVY